MAQVRKSSAARSVLESCERRQGAALSITRVSGERLSSGGAVLNSVRLSLLLACSAVGAAPGLTDISPHRITPPNGYLALSVGLTDT